MPRVAVIRNAVDLDRFELVRRRDASRTAAMPTGVPLLLMVANLAPHKGQATALRCVARLKAMGRTVRLMLVGAERGDAQGFEAQLRGIASALQIEEQVEFAGFRRDVPALLAAADFLLLPSTHEGLPLVILEAQAAGAIVLAAPTAGIPEVIEHGRTGFLVASDDDEGYAAHIVRLLGDDGEAEAIRTTAQAYVRRHHSMGDYCSRIVSEYERLLSGV
jgi:glycosyltransferase involved in cell wall biosynthesis